MWIGILAMMNVRDRKYEIGVLRALGHGSIFYGLYAPDESMKNPFEKRKLNHQLGLFDEVLDSRLVQGGVIAVVELAVG